MQDVSFVQFGNASFQKEIQQEMSTEEVKRVISELASIGVQVVNFTGGEPTLQKDLPELLIYAKDLGLMPTNRDEWVDTI